VEAINIAIMRVRRKSHLEVLPTLKNVEHSLHYINCQSVTTPEKLLTGIHLFSDI
jgi:hypothetical protein